MLFSRRAKRVMKPYGGLAFLDRIDWDLSKLDSVLSLPGKITLGGVEWTFIGRGSDRFVYAYEGLVMKLPLDEGLANETEFRIWTELEVKSRTSGFAPCLGLLEEYPCGSVLIQARISGENPVWDSDLLDKLEKALASKCKPIKAVPGDISTDNFIGHTCVDYGRFWFV